MDGFTGSGVSYGLIRKENQNNNEDKSEKREDSTMSEPWAQRRRYRKLLSERGNEEDM